MSPVSNDLTFDQKERLMRLVMDLREPRPIGIVGLIEARNLLAVLFDEFVKVRDSEVDDLIDRLVENTETPPASYREVVDEPEKN